MRALAQRLALGGGLMLLLTAGAAGPLSAQLERGRPTAADAAAIQERLLEEIARRDAMILSLARRLERLERQVSMVLARPPTPQAPSPPAAGAAASSPAPAEPAPAPVARTQPAPSAPGQFEVDEDAIDRALERTLVEAGVLLLPVGKAEFRPAFSYMRREADSLLLLTDAQGGRITGRSEVRRNVFDLDLGLRLGLPFDSQLEFQLPYRVVEQSTARFPDVAASERTGAGVGDISVGLAKTLLMEGAWWPDVIARLTWDSASGERRDDDITLSGGFNEIRASLSALKRQDPLAFTGAATYETTFERDGIDPGDALSFSIGAVLAASPETSLRVALNQTFSDELEADGRSIAGTDEVSSTLTIGAAAVLGRGVLIDVSGDIGLTEDAPDYAARVALPIRFDLPIPRGTR